MARSFEVHARLRVGLIFLMAAGRAVAEAELPRLDCVIEPHRVVELSSRVDGIVAAMKVKRGDRVEPGQVIAELDSGVEQASVASARARAAMSGELRANEVSAGFGKRARERVAELYTKKAISYNEVDKADTEARLANAKLQQARESQQLAQLELIRAVENLKLMTIRSPIPAVVVERYLEPGESVEDRPIVRLAELDPLWVEAIVPAALFGRIVAGKRAQVYPEAPLDGPFEAEVAIVDPVIDAASGTFRVRLSLPNPEYRLPSGLKCQVGLMPEPTKQVERTALRGGDALPPRGSAKASK